MSDKPVKIRDLRKKEHFWVDDEYLNGYAALCGIHATGVYLALCRHADRNQRSFPSTRHMAQRLGIGKNTVTLALKTLEKWAIVRKVPGKRRSNGTLSVTRYDLLDKSTWKPKPVPPTGTSTSPSPRHQPVPPDGFSQSLPEGRKGDREKGDLIEGSSGSVKINRGTETIREILIRYPKFKRT